MRIASGQPVRLSTEVRDAGVLVTPGSILLRVKRQDGTFLPDYTTPVVDATGKYHQDVPSGDLATLGHYAYVWITTGTAAGVSPPAAFEVVDPFVPTHINYSDVLERLELTTATLSASRQAELQQFMASAVTEQENAVGAVAPRAVTETITASGGRLWPATRPVLSVTSATLNGVTQVTSGWTVRYDVITPASGYGFSGTYVVQLVAGRNPVPQDLVEAALLRVQHSYATQRGGGAGASRIIGAATDDVSAGPDGSDFLLMLRALDKEKPYHLVAVA